MHPITIAHPSRYFIHYLLSREPGGQKFEAEPIITELDRLQLPYPRHPADLASFLETLKIARSQMKVPSAFNPRASVQNDKTSAFLTKWKIREAWTSSPAFLRAFEILRNEGEVSRAMKVMLLGPVYRPAIAKELKRFFRLKDTQMNPLVVRTFEHYFWNAGLLDVQSWRKTLSKFHSPGVTQDLIHALEAPRSEIGVDITMGIALRGGTGISARAAYTVMRENGLKLFLEAAPTGVEASLLSRAQTTGIAFTVFKNSEEELQRLSGGNTDLVEELRRIQTAYDTSPLKTPREIPVLAKNPYASPDEDTTPAIEGAPQ